MENPIHIRYYENGNVNMRSINEAKDIIIEDKTARYLGQKLNIAPEIEEKMKPLVRDAIERYKQGIKGIIRQEPFIEVVKEYK